MSVRPNLRALLVLALALAGCTDPDDRATDDAGSATPDVDSGAALGCTATVNVDFVFYQNTCVQTWVECEGQVQDAMDGDRGGGFCDLMSITCDAPDRTETAVRVYRPGARDCELCTDADGDMRCTPLPPGCGTHEIEHLASGSEAIGPRPQYAAVCDDDAGTADAGS